APVTTCDLHEYLTAGLSGGAGQVYNPYEPQGSRTLYPNNQIPQAAMMAVDPTCASGCTLTTAEKILALLPAPNSSGAANSNGTFDNYSANSSGSFNHYPDTGA